MTMGQKAFQINSADNVATALSEVAPGEITITGEGLKDKITAAEVIPQGHKIAVRDIKQGEPIIKYGVPIGTATADIHNGAWVHLHCMRSNYDERSSHLDIYTGVPLDQEY